MVSSMLTVPSGMYNRPRPGFYPSFVVAIVKHFSKYLDIFVSRGQASEKVSFSPLNISI